MINFKSQLKDVNTFVFDMDGVLTDGNMLLMPDGEMIRKMSFKDGYAIQLAAKKGYRLAIISGGKSKGIKERFERLGVQDIYLGVHNKIEIFEQYVSDYDLDISKILYMGDDIPDYEVMQKVGIPTCPADAAEEIKKISKYISHRKGGEGCVRDIIEQTLKMQGHWMNGDGFSW